MELTVVDMNDNWPEFDQPAYYASIPENSAKDTFVTKVTVSLTSLMTSLMTSLNDVTGEKDRIYSNIGHVGGILFQKGVGYYLVCFMIYKYNRRKKKKFSNIIYGKITIHFGGRHIVRTMTLSFSGLLIRRVLLES